MTKPPAAANGDAHLPPPSDGLTALVSEEDKDTSNEENPPKTDENTTSGA